jgi:hypothetical protein
MLSSIFIFFEVVFLFFFFFIGSSSIFFKGCFSTWVKIRLHTKNQLPRLSGSALKVPGCVGGLVPTRY